MGADPEMGIINTLLEAVEQEVVGLPVVEPVTRPKPPAAGMGRIKGSQNRINRDVKAMILKALTAAGGVEYLTKQADAKPVAFMALLGRIIPTQVVGPDNGPIQVEDVTLERIYSRIARLVIEHEAE